MQDKAFGVFLMNKFILCLNLNEKISRRSQRFRLLLHDSFDNVRLVSMTIAVFEEFGWLTADGWSIGAE